METWDNSQEHKDDILNFMAGRKEPSSYVGGKYVYWIAAENEVPFAMIMSIHEIACEEIGPLKNQHLPPTGNTYGLDFMIGNPDFHGKGYGAKTLVAFMDFFQQEVDTEVQRFWIDPEIANPRAVHVYGKAGFDPVGEFTMRGDCSGAGKPHVLMVKSL